MGDFSHAVRVLRDHYDGSYERLLEDFRQSDRFNWARLGEALNAYAMAAAYSPDPERPGQVLLPFDMRTGQLIPEIWERWLAYDPVRMASNHVTELQALHHIHVEAGRSDEYMLDVGSGAFSAELERLGVEHSFELFDGGHGGVSYRYAPAIRNLLLKLKDLED
jgi:hypothetical protein